MKHKRHITSTFLITLAAVLLVTISCEKEKDKKKPPPIICNGGDKNGFVCGDTFTDVRDSTVYTTVQIGNQCWMAENLRYLPEVSDPSSNSITVPHYYVYGYEGTDLEEALSTENYKTYGVLYNWVAAMDGSASSVENPSGVRGICPEGWHLPSRDEWRELVNYCGHHYFAGGMLKEAGYEHWAEPPPPYYTATNETGFTALPGGKYSSYSFYSLRHLGYWWTARGVEIGCYAVLMFFSDSSIEEVFSICHEGLSVRCLRVIEP